MLHTLSLSDDFATRVPSYALQPVSPVKCGQPAARPAAHMIGVGVAASDAWFIGALEQLFQTSDRFDLRTTSRDVVQVLLELNGPSPSIAIIDCDGPCDELFATLQRFHRKIENVRVVIRYHKLRPGLVRDAMQAGVWACFAMDDGPETVLGILHSVAGGRMSFPFVDFTELQNDPFEQLTRRERDVLKALSQGWTNLQISTRLGISENTVKYHLKLIFGKLGVTSRAAAVSQYLQQSTN